MAEGQFSGTRKAYKYTNDAGQDYILLCDETLASLAGTGLEAATSGNVGGATPKPQRFKPRGVYWQANSTNQRKFIICGDESATLYANDISASLTIDGIAGSTTGRRGETLSFYRLGSAPAAPGGGGA